MRLFLCQFRRMPSADADFCQLRIQFIQKAFIEIGHHRVDTNCCGRQLLRSSHTGRIVGIQVAPNGCLQAADAHHKELVQVRCSDCEKPETFEQWYTFIPAFIQYALVELKPTQFSIDETIRHSKHLQWSN